MRSAAQFSFRPGVNGIPPIVTSTNTRWFGTTLIGDEVFVNDGTVYLPPGYTPNSTEYTAPLNTRFIASTTLALTEATEQRIVVRLPLVAGHAEQGDPLYAAFDDSGFDGIDFSGNHTVQSDGGTPVTLYGTAHKALWLELSTEPEVIRVDLADVDAATDVVLAEVTYSVENGYRLTPRHDGAIFVFPPVWVTANTWNV